MGRLDSGAPAPCVLAASGENQLAATTQGPGGRWTGGRPKIIANLSASVGRSWRPWLVTVVVVVGAMAIISGISQLAAKASSPSIALSDR